MQLQSAIQKRKSVKKYSKKKPDWRKIIEAIDSARYAPAAGNIFAQKFILIDDVSKIQKIANESQQPFIAQAQYVVAVCSDPKILTNSFDKRGELYMHQQAGAAIQNFLLSLTEQGLETTWVGHFYEKPIKTILKIPAKVELEAIFPIGLKSKVKGTKTRQRVKTDLDNIIRFNDYKEEKMN
jgi:nitroreductase